MSNLNIYPVGGYITKTIRDLLHLAEPLKIFIVRDLVMASFKGAKVISPKYFGQDRNVSEKEITDAIDLAERQGVLQVEYSENAKGYPQMSVEPTEKCVKALQEAKDAASKYIS